MADAEPGDAPPGPQAPDWAPSPGDVPPGPQAPDWAAPAWAIPVETDPPGSSPGPAAESLVRIGAEAETDDQPWPDDPWLPGSRRPDRRAPVIGVIVVAGLLAVASTAWLVGTNQPEAGGAHGTHQSRPGQPGSGPGQPSQALSGHPVPTLTPASQPAPAQTGTGPSHPGHSSASPSLTSPSHTSPTSPPRPGASQTAASRAGSGQSGTSRTGNGQHGQGQPGQGQPGPRPTGASPPVSRATSPATPVSQPTRPAPTSPGQPRAARPGSGPRGHSHSRPNSRPGQHSRAGQHGGSGQHGRPGQHSRPGQHRRPGQHERPGHRPAPAGQGIVSVGPGLGARPGVQRVVALLDRYFAAVNRRDYQAYERLFAQRHLTPRQFAWGYRTSHDSKASLVGVASLAGGLKAMVTFTSHQDPAVAPDHSSCIDWRITLFLRRAGGTYLIGTPPAGYRAQLHACRFAPREASQGHPAARGHAAARGHSAARRSGTHPSSKPGPGHQRRTNRWG